MEEIFYPNNVYVFIGSEAGTLGCGEYKINPVANEWIKTGYCLGFKCVEFKLVYSEMSSAWVLFKNSDIFLHLDAPRDMLPYGIWHNGLVEISKNNMQHWIYEYLYAFDLNFSMITLVLGVIIVFLAFIYVILKKLGGF